MDSLPEKASRQSLCLLPMSSFLGRLVTLVLSCKLQRPLQVKGLARNPLQAILAVIPNLEKASQEKNSQMQGRLITRSSFFTGVIAARGFSFRGEKRKGSEMEEFVLRLGREQQDYEQRG